MNNNLNHEISLLKKQLQEQKESLDKKDDSNRLLLNKQKENASNELNKAVESYKSDISKQNKQIQQLQKDIAKLKENQQELYKLRELLFNIDTEDDLKIKENIDLDKEVLKLSQKYKIYLVGEHGNVIDKLHNDYPELRIIKKEAMSINASSLTSADYIFIFHKFISHDLYYKVVNALQSKGKSWEFIPYTNIPKTLQCLYDTYTNNE